MPVPTIQLPGLCSPFSHSTTTQCSERSVQITAEREEERRIINTKKEKKIQYFYRMTSSERMKRLNVQLKEKKNQYLLFYKGRLKQTEKILITVIL